MSRTWTKDELEAAHALLELATGGAQGASNSASNNARELHSGEMSVVENSNSTAEDRASLRAFIQHLPRISMTAFPPTTTNQAVGRAPGQAPAVENEETQVLCDHAVSATSILLMGRLLREYGLQMVLVAFDVVSGVENTLDREGTVRKVATLLDDIYNKR